MSMSRSERGRQSVLERGTSTLAPERESKLAEVWRSYRIIAVAMSRSLDKYALIRNAGNNLPKFLPGDLVEDGDFHCGSHSAR